MQYPCGIPEVDSARATTIIGSDEAGLGAWAGPLVTCAVAVPCDWDPPDTELHNPKYGAPGEHPYRDSKALTKPERERVFNRYYGKEISNIVISPCFIEVAEIDEYRVDAALRRAHRRAIEGTYYRLAHSPIVVVDGVVNPNLDTSVHSPRVFCLPKGDQIVPAITLASVIAKVLRDREMVRLASIYEGYGFSRHKGYGTAEHQMALTGKGPCEIHRRSYAPVRKAMKVAAEGSQQRPPWDFDD